MRSLDVRLGRLARMKTSDIPAWTAPTRFRGHNAELWSVGNPPDHDRSSRSIPLELQTKSLIKS